MFVVVRGGACLEISQNLGFVRPQSTTRVHESRISLATHELESNPQPVPQAALAEGYAPDPGGNPSGMSIMNSSPDDKA